jgi:hypothetical protein
VVNAIDLPSALHSREAYQPPPKLIRRLRSPSAFINMLPHPPRSLRKTILLPSGEKLGSVSTPGVGGQGAAPPAAR